MSYRRDDTAGHAVGVTVTQAEQVAIDQIVLTARKTAGAANAEAALREGSAMSAADAIDYALGVRPANQV